MRNTRLTAKRANIQSIRSLRRRGLMAPGNPASHGRPHKPANPTVIGKGGFVNIDALGADAQKEHDYVKADVLHSAQQSKFFTYPRSQFDRKCTKIELVNIGREVFGVFIAKSWTKERMIDTIIEARENMKAAA